MQKKQKATLKCTSKFMLLYIVWHGFASVCSVFTSKFRILWDIDGKDSNDDLPVRASSDTSEVPWDEDGDLDVVRRPRSITSDRDAVCPIILSQSAATSSDQDEDSEEEGESTHDFINIGESHFTDKLKIGISEII